LAVYFGSLYPFEPNANYLDRDYEQSVVEFIERKKRKTKRVLESDAG